MALCLHNDVLHVTCDIQPAVISILHKQTRLCFEGARPSACIAVNGVPVGRQEWRIEKADAGRIVYGHARDGLQLSVSLTLQGDMVEFSVESILDESCPLDTLSFSDEWVFVCAPMGFSIYRYLAKRREWHHAIARGLYLHSQGGQAAPCDAVEPDAAPVPCMMAAAFNDDLGLFFSSNQPYFPVRTRVAPSQYPGRGGAFELMPNTWQYRVRSKRAPLLKFGVTFSGDINGDGRVDEQDYLLFMNRRIRQPDPLYRERVWYKIMCQAGGTVQTSLADCMRIIEAVHNLSFGTPQLVYLVGWQRGGHDHVYPGLDEFNGNLGGREAILRFMREAKERFGCIVSFHINIDDAYKSEPAYDPGIICRDIDGSEMKWETFWEDSYHICHTYDVESGKLFKRLNRFLELLPVERSIHFDAYRPTNASWGKDGYIGLAEEFYCGQVPIREFMAARGIDITTESADSVVDPSQIHSAVWHMCDRRLMLYHGKILGGGHGNATQYQLGTGCAINSDFDSRLLCGNGDELCRHLYLARALYLYYLQFEMRELRVAEHGKRARLRFGDDVVAIIDDDPPKLLVTRAGVLLADNDTRYLPFEGERRIFAYSHTDAKIERPLPEWAAGCRLTLRCASDKGVTAFNDYTVAGGMILLNMKAYRPVLIEAAPER